MNLYAAVPAYAPDEFETGLFLAKDDAKAMDMGIFIAAQDACTGHMSTTAEVYLIARDVERIGTAHASDAPAGWEWAHPGVEEAIAHEALMEAEYASRDHL